MVKKRIKENVLELGWKVNRNMDPEYWLKPNPKPGKQKESDLVTIPAYAIAGHTAIIAQSGSGKSFFLGRYIEEILLKTKAKCIILDPNADFRKIFEPEIAERWNNVNYSTNSRCDRLPTEGSRQTFQKSWEKIKIKVMSGRGKGDDHFEQIKLNWASLSVEFLAENVSPTLKNGLYHCHIFTKSIGQLIEYQNSIKSRKKMNFLDDSEALLNKLIQERVKAKEVISDLFKPAELIKELSGRRSWPSYFSYGKNDIMELISSAETASQYVTEDVALFYFGKARELKSSKLIELTGYSRKRQPFQNVKLEVVDLPSIADKQIRLLAISSIIASEWNNSRVAWNHALNNKTELDTRVPVFIIIDEAHNLIPIEPQGSAELSLREQFRTIISEGRKYGIFLIVVTQRPDKIDPLILSECDNKVIMKLSTMTVLDITRKVMGLDSIDLKILEKCLDFELGRGILLGKWVNNIPQLFYSAARRTMEGGRNLRAEYWAMPDDGEPIIKEGVKPDFEEGVDNFLRREKTTLDGPIILGTMKLPELH